MDFETKLQELLQIGRRIAGEANQLEKQLEQARANVIGIEAQIALIQQAMPKEKFDAIVSGQPAAISPPTPEPKKIVEVSGGKTKK